MSNPNGAVAVKDHLYSLLNDANSVHETVAACETIVVVLSNTQGFWEELTYCYKAAEIAAHAKKALSRFTTVKLHHNTRRMLEKRIDTLTILEDRYFKLQHSQMQKAA